MNTRNYLSVSSPTFFSTADLIRRTVILSLLFHFFRQHRKDSDIGVFIRGVFDPCLFERASHKPSSVANTSFLQLALLFALLPLPTSMFYWNGQLVWTPAPGRDLICDSLCPHHVGRKITYHCCAA